MTFQNSELAALGWSTFFNSQLEPDDFSAAFPARVMAVHRNGLLVTGPGGDKLIPPYFETLSVEDDGDEESTATVGDWLLLETETLRPKRLLRRKSLFKRRAPGTGHKLQLIAANIDTLLIVSSCNQDFNIARLERYLVLAREADVMAVVVLTKADLAEAPEEFARPAAKLSPGLVVEVLDARDPESVACLGPWCGPGQTVALLGSSGVGKSTLINTLTGTGEIATSGIRLDDAKGRHTTTARSLHSLPTGGWLLDTPGMRELQLTDVKAGLEDVFAEIMALASSCRFGDCRHEAEPGCAVRAALEAGTLDAERLRRWRKLVAEDARNSESLAERRTRMRALSKMYRSVQENKSRRRGS